MSATTETLQTRLAEAEEAYHKLQMGTAAIEVVDANGERVVFNRTSIDRLRAYIAELRGLLGLPVGTKPLGYLF